MNICNLKIQNLKKKKNEIKSKRKEINTTFNDPTETDRELIDLDNEISKERINILNQQQRERQQKREQEQQVVMNEVKEVIIECFKVLRRIGIIKHTSEFGLVLGKSPCYFRLYENDYINKIKVSSLESLRENMFSLKTGLNEWVQSDSTLPPKDWILGKINDLIDRLDKLQYKVFSVQSKE